jgi:hypothetical protein
MLSDICGDGPHRKEAFRAAGKKSVSANPVFLPLTFLDAD